MSVGAGTTPGVKRALAGWRVKNPPIREWGNRANSEPSRGTRGRCGMSCRTVPKSQSISL